MYRAAVTMLLVATTTASAQLPPEAFWPEEPGPIVVPPEFCPPTLPSAPPATRRPHVAEKAAAQRDMVIRWNDAALAAIRDAKTPPPIAARNLAMVHVAIYDSVMAVRKSHQPFRVRMNAPPGTSPDAAAAVAAHRTLISLYPKRIPTFDAILDASLETIPEGAGKVDGISLGHAVAERVLAWRADDGTRGRTAYKPGAKLGGWQPTPPDFRAALLPHWTAVRGFALTDFTDLRPTGPPALSSEEFSTSFKEVKELGGVNSTKRTPEQTEIARFWADGDGTITPPGHWNRIARTLALERQNSLAGNARLFAMLNVAMADAAIACWDCKFKFDFWRPITAIREAAKLNSPALTADPEWLPLLPTPPFPAYISGHSTFSGAAAAVLATFFGTDNVRFATTSDGLPGVTRSFSSLSAAAKEAGMSRIYGGIHWSFDNRDGLAGGKKVGEYVAANFFQPVKQAPRPVPPADSGR